MPLPIRYQFILAPLVIVVVLTCLVTYTLIELANIHRQNELTVKWVILADRAQAAVANATLLDRIVQEQLANQPNKSDEYLFNYLEQSRILVDSLLDMMLMAEFPADLQIKLEATRNLLRDPEHANPTAVHDSLMALLPPLEHQQKIFMAQRRSAYVDYHRHLSVIISRMYAALLSILGLCIALAVGLGIWGLHNIRQRLKLLTQHAQAVCAGNLAPLPAPVIVRDELDELELCLARMTQRLFDVVAVEKVLQGSEDERRRIAMDMHDGVLADLTALTRGIDTLQLSSMVNGRLTELRRAVDDIIKSIRHTIDDLHPQTLEILGLESALRSFLDRHCNLPDLPPYHVECDPLIETALQLPQKINLFRIITEAVHNLLRHARCNRFEISLRIVAQRLIVTVEDNGIGMPVDTTVTGHGITNITERARTLGANVRWRAARFASGACVELTLPLGLVS
ncbi:MAG: hypothetical protein HY080_09910 [Gammaproteobacteria bacterium]|nr:hypothetical protein [Gammaproteobacteria bacterium]